MPNGGGPSWAQEQPDLAGYIQLVEALPSDERSAKALSIVSAYWARLAGRWEREHEIGSLESKIGQIEELGGTVPSAMRELLKSKQEDYLEWQRRFRAKVLELIVAGRGDELQPRIYSWPKTPEDAENLVKEIAAAAAF